MMIRMERGKDEKKEVQEPPKETSTGAKGEKNQLTSPLIPRLLLMTASPHPVTAL